MRGLNSPPTPTITRPPNLPVDGTQSNRDKERGQAGLRPGDGILREDEHTQELLQRVQAVNSWEDFINKRKGRQRQGTREGFSVNPCSIWKAGGNSKRAEGSAGPAALGQGQRSKASYNRTQLCPTQGRGFGVDWRWERPRRLGGLPHRCRGFQPVLRFLTVVRQGWGRSEEGAQRSPDSDGKGRALEPCQPGAGDPAGEAADTLESSRLPDVRVLRTEHGEGTATREPVTRASVHGSRTSCVASGKTLSLILLVYRMEIRMATMTILQSYRMNIL